MRHVLIISLLLALLGCSNNPTEPGATSTQVSFAVIPPQPTCPPGTRPYPIVSLFPTPRFIAWVCGPA